MKDNENTLPDEQWLRLMLAASEVGLSRLQALLEYFESAEGIFQAGRRACSAVIGETASRALFDDERQRQAEMGLDWIQETPQASVVSWMDCDFPKELLLYPSAPSLFFLRGRRELLQTRRIALTGTKRPDAEGLLNADSFADALIRCGRAVVTFLESETDAAVARAALKAEAEGKAGLLVLGATGPDRLYPAGMRELYHRSADQGLIITPFMPGITVSQQTLTQRQIVCAYLCSELLVIQSEFSGKAQSLARLFAEHNREVFVIPGSIHNALYKGSHKLLREGARLTETVSDITRFGSEFI